MRHRFTRSRVLAFLTILCLGMALATPVLAETKVGVVDLQRVLKSTNAGKAAQKKFEDLRKSKQNQLQAKEKDLAKRQSDIVAVRNELERAIQAAQGKMTEEIKGKIAALQEKGRKFEEDLAQHEKVKGDALEELAKKEADLLKPIEDIIRKKVEAIAKERGLAVVLNKQVTIYTSESVDITAEVIKRCDAP